MRIGVFVVVAVSLFIIHGIQNGWGEVNGEEVQNIKLKRKNNPIDFI